MEDKTLGQRIQAVVEPILEGMGIALVELSTGHTHRRIHISLVIYRPAGVPLDLCAQVSRLVHSRLEMIEELADDMTLEVSSPGINRKLTAPREYSIFKGRGVKIMLSSTSEWMGGVIQDYQDNIVLIRQGEREVALKISEIKKAILSSEQEGKKDNVL